jgi:hypothetical protein
VAGVPLSDLDGGNEEPALVSHEEFLRPGNKGLLPFRPIESARDLARLDSAIFPPTLAV